VSLCSLNEQPPGLAGHPSGWALTDSSLMAHSHHADGSQCLQLCELSLRRPHQWHIREQGYLGWSHQPHSVLHWLNWHIMDTSVLAPVHWLLHSLSNKLQVWCLLLIYLLYNNSSVTFHRNSNSTFDHMNTCIYLNAFNVMLPIYIRYIQRMCLLWYICLYNYYYVFGIVTFVVWRHFF